MPEQRWSGHWWRDGQDEFVPGVLVVDEAGQSTLDLIGGFPEELTRSAPAARRDDHLLEMPAPVIFGDAEGRKITLWRSISLQFTGTPGRPRAQTLSAQIVLIGGHVRPDDAVFTSAALQLEHLGTWLGWPEVERTSNAESTSFTASVRSHQHGLAAVDGWTISADTWVDQFRLDRLRAGDRLETIAAPYLRLRPEVPRTAAGFFDLIHSLSDLLTLASGVPSGIARLTFAAIPVPGSQPTSIEAYGRRVHTAKPEAAAVSDYDHRFTCLDVPFDQQVERWLAIREQAGSACNVHFGASYARAGFTETRLLLHVIAAESLHASLHPDAIRVGEHEAASARKALKAAGLSTQTQTWAIEQLSNNRPTFRQRLVELAELPSSAAVQHVIRDIPVWAAAVVRARNGLAHDGSHGGDLGLFYLEWVTSSLITLVFMRLLGIPDHAQLRAAQNVLRFPGASSEVPTDG